MYERTAELLNRAFEQYTLTELCAEGQIYEDNLTVKYSFSYPLKEDEKSLVRTEIEAPSLPNVQEGEIAGQMRIFLENSLLFSQNLYMMKK